GNRMHDLFAASEPARATETDTNGSGRGRKRRRERRRQQDTPREIEVGGQVLHITPRLIRMAEEDARTTQLEHKRRHPQNRARGRMRPRTRFAPPSRPTVVEELDDDGLLPAITFVFSRAGCDDAVRQCVSSGLVLTTPEEAAQIREYAETRCADIPAADLAVLGFDQWLRALEAGVSSHHAGMLPAFKEIVEHLF